MLKASSLVTMVKLAAHTMHEWDECSTRHGVSVGGDKGGCGCWTRNGLRVTGPGFESALVHT